MVIKENQILKYSHVKTTIKDQIHIQNLAHPFPYRISHTLKLSLPFYLIAAYYSIFSEMKRLTNWICQLEQKWSEVEDLCGGQGAVAVEIVHEGEGVAVFQCRGLLLFVFDVHSHHYLHFLEGFVHFFHRFPTLSRENWKQNEKIKRWICGYGNER